MDTRAKKQDQFHNQIKSNFTGAGLTEEQGLIPNRSQEGPTRWHLHLNQGLWNRREARRHILRETRKQVKKESRDTGKKQVSADES